MNPRIVKFIKIPFPPTVHCASCEKTGAATVDRELFAKLPDGWFFGFIAGGSVALFCSEACLPLEVDALTAVRMTGCA